MMKHALAIAIAALGVVVVGCTSEQTDPNEGTEGATASTEQAVANCWVPSYCAHDPDPNTNLVLNKAARYRAGLIKDYIKGRGNWPSHLGGFAAPGSVNACTWAKGLIDTRMRNILVPSAPTSEAVPSRITTPVCGLNDTLVDKMQRPDNGIFITFTEATQFSSMLDQCFGYAGSWWVPPVSKFVLVYETTAATCGQPGEGFRKIALDPGPVMLDSPLGSNDNATAAAHYTDEVGDPMIPTPAPDTVAVKFTAGALGFAVCSQWPNVIDGRPGFIGTGSVVGTTSSRVIIKKGTRCSNLVPPPGDI